MERAAVASWALRRPEPVPADVARTLARQYAYGGLLAELLWQRGVDDAASAVAFLEPSLSRGLRAPAPDGGLQAFVAALMEVGGAVRVEAAADADLATALAATALAEQLGAEAGPTLRLAPAAWTLETAHGDVASWTPGVPGDGLPPDAGVATAALYVLATRRRHAERAPDARRALDVLALAVLAEADVIAVRDEQRTIAVVGLAGLARRPGTRALLASADLEDPAPWLVRRRLVPRLDAVWRTQGLAGLRRVFAATDAAEADAAAADAALAFARHPRATTASALPETTAYDAELPLATLSPGLARALARLEPHGRANPEPLFLARAVRFDGARLAGDLARPFQRVRLRQDGRTVRAVAFGFGVIEAAPEERFDVLFGVRAIAGGLETRLRGLRSAEESTS